MAQVVAVAAGHRRKITPNRTWTVQKEMRFMKLLRYNKWQKVEVYHINSKPMITKWKITRQLYRGRKDSLPKVKVAGQISILKNSDISKKIAKSQLVVYIQHHSLDECGNVITSLTWVHVDQSKKWNKKRKAKYSDPPAQGKQIMLIHKAVVMTNAFRR